MTKTDMFENKAKTESKVQRIISIDDDLSHENIQMGLPISEIRGYLFTEDGYRFQLIYGKMESATPFREGSFSTSSLYQRPDHIFGKTKNGDWICSRNLEKLKNYKE